MLNITLHEIEKLSVVDLTTLALELKTNPVPLPGVIYSNDLRGISENKIYESLRYIMIVNDVRRLLREKVGRDTIRV